MSGQPPRLAAWLVTLSTVEPDRQAVLGDLFEEFAALEQQAGTKRARRWFWRQTLSSLVPGFSRRLKRVRREALPSSALPGFPASQLPGFQA
ncbi:MAG TPA: permease prefix domain 2-containing transporter, partial [Vicinamibacterales bacterium]